MTVMCQIVQSDRGYEGIIQNAATGQTLHNTGFQPCAEDTDRMMESVILRNKWFAIPHPVYVKEQR